MASTISDASLLDVNNLLPETDHVAADNHVQFEEQNTDESDAPESKAENVNNNYERDDELREQIAPMLRGDRRENTSPGTSRTQSTETNPENDVPERLRSSSRLNVPDEKDLREKLRIFLDTPRLQWTQRRIISNYALGQTVKTIFVSVLVITFGRVVFDHQDFMANSEEALRHIYFENWTNLLYSKAYALYTKPDFFRHVDYVLTQFNRTPEYSVGPYNFKESDGENRDPPRLHITYYPHLELHPSKAKYSFHGKPVTECFTVYPVNKTDPVSKTTKQEYDIQTSLGTIRFDNTSEILLELHLTAIYVGSWTRVTSRSKDAFECYDFTVWITYENTNDNGALAVDLRIEDHQIPCNKQHTDPTSLVGVPIGFCLAVFVLSVVSISFVSRKVHKTRKLKNMTVVYFEKKKKIKLGDAELRIFVNMWDRTIIASDIFLMAGCIMQFLLTLVKQTRKDATFDLCAMLLGTGCLLSWISLIRDLDIMSRNCNIMVLTLQKALYPRIVSFLACVALLYIGFLLCGWLVLGPYITKFNNLSVTSETIFSLINGDDVFATFSLLNDAPTRVKVYGQLYLYIYLCIFIYVVVNVCISILTDAYEEIRGFYRDGFPKTAIERFVEENDGLRLRDESPKPGRLYPVLKYICPIKEEQDLKEWRKRVESAGSSVV